MDIEKIKKSYKWDPTKGDYTKSDLSIERRLQKRKQNQNHFMKLVSMIKDIFKTINYFGHG